MEWNKSYMVKDVLSIMHGVNRHKDYTTSFRPDLLKKVVDVALDCPERPEDFKFTITPPEHEYKQICLTSGGADSTIAWYYAGKPQGLYIDIGQPYAAKERMALHMLEIPYHYVDLRGSHVGDESYMWKHIIPGRNFLFLTVAAEMLRDYGNIWFAMVDGEGAESDKGDKSLMFVERFMDWYNQCTGRTIYVQTMVARTKAGWVKWFADNHDVNIIRSNTVTCFNARAPQCGKCQACLRKYLSFMSNDIDINTDFDVHPLLGAEPYVKKYEKVLAYALGKQDYSHYSRQRCLEDLKAIGQAKSILGIK